MIFIIKPSKAELGSASWILISADTAEAARQIAEASRKEAQWFGNYGLTVEPFQLALGQSIIAPDAGMIPIGF